MSKNLLTDKQYDTTLLCLRSLRLMSSDSKNRTFAWYDLLKILFGENFWFFLFPFPFTSHNFRTLPMSGKFSWWCTMRNVIEKCEGWWEECQRKRKSFSYNKLTYSINIDGVSRCPLYCVYVRIRRIWIIMTQRQYFIVKVFLYLFSSIHFHIISFSFPSFIHSFKHIYV